MKQLSAVINSLTFVLLSLVTFSSSAQLVGDNAFLQGRYVEAGIASNGSMGSNRIVPSGYHTRSPSFSTYDPGLGAFNTSASRLMMVYDAGHDGWGTGIPTGYGYFGDYSMPGTPYEGWSVAINGVRGDANFQTFLGTGTGYTLTLPMTGTVTGYTNSGGTMTGTWQGTAGTGGPLSIKQVFVLDTNASWVRVNVTLKNTSSTALTGVYYMRHLDPDNDQYISGNFNTLNTINYQNDYYHRVMVTAAGTYFTSQTVSLLTKDCRAKCYSAPSWPCNSSTTALSAYWGGSGPTCIYTGSQTGDYAMGMVWNLGNIAAGDSTVLQFAYVYNGLLGLDSAVGFPQMVVNGVARDSIDTVTACAFAGDTLWANITNATTADWTGSTWTWAPSSYLLSTTGVSNGILASTMTAPVTYTITGTSAIGGCGSKIFRLTVMPPGVTPTPTVHDTSFCQGAPTGSIGALASGIGTIMWFTSATGGVGTSTAPTPSTATPGLYTWYVSQVVAGCSSGRVPINVSVVTPAPPIAGPDSVCQGSTITLSNTTAGGTWVSSNTAVGTIGSLTGIVGGVGTATTVGTTNISYMLGSGCMVTKIIYVNPTPPAITGTINVCVGSTATLSNTLPGGIWSCSTSTLSFPSPTSGVVVGGLPAGTATVTYSTFSGCQTTRVMTVVPLPNPIVGSLSLCVGTCTSLTSSSPGGIWSSGAPSSGTPATSIATVGAASGYACGIAAGTATISYRISGCATTAVVTIVGTPAAIVGTPIVCQGSTVTLTHPSPGGTWSIGAPSLPTPASLVATISGGVVTGVGAGTATVTYSLGGSCYATTIVTVTAAPGAITGTGSVCVGSCTTLTHSTGGGTWTIGTPSSSGIPTAVCSLASSGSGVVCGVAGGTATLSYTLPGGCMVTTLITVNAPPNPITGTLALCSGATSLLTSTTGGGTWSIGTPASGTPSAIATISSGGTVTAGVAGTVTVSYAVSGCVTTAVMTVNPNPGAITASSTVVCQGATISLGSTPGGGTWTTTAANASVDPSTGVVTGGTPSGTAIITYTLGSTGCYTTTTVTVNASPSISGPTALCALGTATLTGTPSGGAWTSSGSAASVSSSGVVTAGSAAGTATISYTVSGCSATSVVTVNSNPTISGLTAVCVGSSQTLSASVGGGTWSTPCAFASVGASTGIVTGISAGVCVITYTTPGGCTATTSFTVYATPSAIVGGPSICVGSTVTMSSTPTGGTWLVSGAATIGLSSGALTASASGTVIVTYTTPTTFCTTTKVVTVVAAPAAIGGPLAVCVGSTTTLTNATSGGTWSTACSNVSIDPTTGVATGITAGTCTVTYGIGTGCSVTAVVTVNATPAPISGPSSLCVGATATLTSSINAWNSSNPGVATIIAGTGVVTGITPGTTLITNSFSTTGCFVSMVMTVNATPGAIGGSLSVCIGQTTTLTNSSSGGTWSMACPYATIDAATGVVTGTSSGTCTVTYTATTGCRVTAVVTINALPTTISGPSTVCIGSSITLGSTPSGGTWSLGAPTTIASIGSTSGILTGINAGTVTVTYNVGCFITKVVTVLPIPSPITGPVATCVGACAALGGSPAGGTWSIAPTAIATVSPTGNVCGVLPGTATVSYTMSNGCATTQVMTINGLPGPILGSGIACTGAASCYSVSATGGLWSIAPTTVATVNPTTGCVYGVSTGTATLTYTVGTGCTATTIVTVYASPTPVAGPLAVCALGSTTLTSTPSGGTWVGSACASINPSTGVVTAGGSACTGTVSYMLSTGCSASAVVSINPLPTSIGGAMVVCQGSTATLVGSPSGGTWSIAPSSIATINSATGVWTGVVTGSTSPATATVTYTMGTGCSISAIVTVIPLPTAITGPLHVAGGGTVTLSSTPSGGTWSSGTPANASVVPPVTSGVIQGNIVGTTATITYILGSGCQTSVVVTVDSAPNIMGSLNVCKGNTSSLTASIGGGVWSSTSAFVASVDASTGVVTGNNIGTATISYVITATGITATAIVTVNAVPDPITGPSNVCVGSNITLATTSTGGTWSSSNTAAATVSSGGVVSGIAGYGTSTISYTFSTGCAATHVVAVDSLPSVIAGSSGFCNFTSTILTSSPSGGTWYSTNTSVATINPSTGFITGASVDTVTIIYVSAAGCSRSRLQNIIAGPSAITGPDRVCEGETITVSNAISGGVWSSSTPPVATITPFGTSSGIVTGVAAGTSMITYTLSITGCYDTLPVTVDPLPGAIMGVPVVCEGSTTSLSNSMAGCTWSSGNPAVAAIDATTGVVTGIAGGTATIVCHSPAGCTVTTVVSVNPLPTPIAGSLSICIGTSSSLSSLPSGGAWWSSNPTVANIDYVTGVINGNTVGTTTVTYTLPSSCQVTAVATVYPVPSTIGGPSVVCEGNTITLTITTTGGIWVSSNLSRATVDAATGVVTGVAAGTVNILYQMASGCSSTKSVTVNATPTITGALQVCAGFTTNLIGTPAGGTWTTTTGTSLIGTVNPVTGVVTGISGGTTAITYTLASSCRMNNVMTVNDLPPAIGGIAEVCVAATTTLTNGVGGGTWTSSNPALAVVDPTSGAVTGVSNGTLDITYTISTGCINTRQVTVNPLPAPIMGASTLCGNAMTIFTDATAGGTWGSYDVTIATVASMGTGIGAVTGVATGTTTISYKLNATGCFVTKGVTINVTPPAIAGSGHVCIGSTRLLTNTMSGGVWTSSNPGIAPVSATGVVSGMMLGTAIIAYTLPGSGCAASKMVTVQPLPSEFSVTGGGSYCTGGTGVHVGLNGSEIGVSYALYYGASATGYLTGTNLPLDFGLMTLGGAYTVQATNPTTGCTRNMIGSATVVVTPPSVPHVSINSVPGDTVCPGTMTTVGPVPVNGGASPTYVWKVNGVTVSTAPAYSFIPADGDLVGVTMTSSSGCVLPLTASAEKVLHVAPSMMPTISMSLDPGDTVCQYSLVSITASPSYGGSAPTYTWMVNGSPMGSGPVFTFVPDNGDVIKCRMTSNYLCRLADVVESGTVAMVVDSMIVPHIHITPHPGYAVDSGTMVKFTSVWSDAGTSPTFQWYINGVPVMGATTDSFQSNTLNHYDSVTCRVTSSGICHDVTSYDWAFISVSPLGVQHINAAADIRLIPNPNNGIFTIKGTWGTVDDEITMEVTNMLGQVVFSGKVNARNGKVNEQIQLNNTLANGMYMLNMRTANDAQVFHFVMEQ
jgi:uncharacterized protein YjdB